MVPRTWDEALEYIKQLEDALKGCSMGVPCWALTPTEWEMLTLMINREFVTHEAMSLVTDSDQDVNKVRVCKIRKKLTLAGLGNPIQLKWGSGYWISSEDKKKLHQAMEAERATDTAAPITSSEARHASSSLRAL